MFFYHPFDSSLEDTESTEERVVDGFISARSIEQTEIIPQTVSPAGGRNDS